MGRSITPLAPGELTDLELDAVSGGAPVQRAIGAAQAALIAAGVAANVNVVVSDNAIAVIGDADN